jgi:hypothetical protein
MSDDPTVDARAPAFAAALEQLLPRAEQVLLLRAALQPLAEASRAWGALLERVGDVRQWLESHPELAGISQLLSANLTRHALDPGAALQQHLRTSEQHAFTRAAACRAGLAQAMTSLSAAEIGFLWLGPALPGMQPSIGTSPVDLLVHPNQMTRAVEVLKGRGYAEDAPGHLSHRLRDEQGLEIVLHARLLQLPQFELSGAEARQRRRPAQLDGTLVWGLCPEDALLYACGRLLHHGAQPDLRFACAAFSLCHSTDLNWRRVLLTASRGHLALPVWVCLRWLRRTLGAPIALGYLTELEARARPVDAVTAEGCCAALWARLGPRRTLALLGAHARELRGLLRFRLFPSVAYLRAQHGELPAWQLARLYALQPWEMARDVGTDLARRWKPQRVPVRAASLPERASTVDV